MSISRLKTLPFSAGSPAIRKEDSDPDALLLDWLRFCWQDWINSPASRMISVNVSFGRRSSLLDPKESRKPSANAAACALPMLMQVSVESGYLFLGMKKP